MNLILILNDIPLGGGTTACATFEPYKTVGRGCSVRGYIRAKDDKARRAAEQVLIDRFGVSNLGGTKMHASPMNYPFAFDLPADPGHWNVQNPESAEARTQRAYALMLGFVGDLFLAIGE